MQSKSKKEFFLLRVLMKTPLKKKINNLQNQISQVCPYDGETVQYYAGQVIKSIFIISIIGVTTNLIVNFMILKELDLFTVASSVLLLHVLIQEVTNYKINKLLDKINKEFGLFLSRMKNEYRASHSVIQSLQVASVEFSYEIQQHIKEVENILCAENSDALVQIYTTNPHRHSYIRMFVKLCHQCMNKGDMNDAVTGASIFSKNVEILRTEVSDLVLHNRKQRYKLAGMTWVCVLPTMFLNLFGMWGQSFTTGTTAFYDSYGYIVKIIALVATWYIYNIIQQTKRAGKVQDQQVSSIFYSIRKILNINPKHKFAKQLRIKLEAVKSNTPVPVFYTKMLFFGVVGVISVFCFILYSNENAKKAPLTDTNIESVPTTAYNHDSILNVILNTTNAYRDYNMDEITDEQIIYDINQQIFLPNMFMKNAMVEEIRARVFQYQQISFKWWQLLFSLCGGLAAFVPLWDLNYTYSIYKKNKENELKLFQIIILLNKDFPTTTTLSILENMEAQSLFYKPILLQALNEYQIDSQRALRLLHAEKDEAFQNIVNNLISIDKVGAKKAFSEIEMDITYTEKRHQIEQNISDDNEKALLDILSVIPAIIVIGGYFILPFMLDSWVELAAVFELFETMQSQN